MLRDCLAGFAAVAAVADSACSKLARVAPVAGSDGAVSDQNFEVHRGIMLFSFSTGHTG